MRTLRTFLTVIGAVTVLILAANTVAYAATGGKFILGHTNKANKVSTLKRTSSGAALNLVTKSSGNAPLSTNGKGRVTNLNADMLDGLDSSTLRTRSYVFHASVTASTGFDLAIPVPAGSYLISWTNFLQLLGPASVDCYVLEQNPGAPDRQTARVAFNNDTTGGNFYPSASGSGIVTKKTGGTITFSCVSVGDDFQTYSGTPIEIVATPTTVLSTSTLTARIAPRIAPKGSVLGQHAQ